MNQRKRDTHPAGPHDPSRDANARWDRLMDELGLAADPAQVGDEELWQDYVDAPVAEAGVLVGPAGGPRHGVDREVEVPRSGHANPRSRPGSAGSSRSEDDLSMSQVRRARFPWPWALPLLGAALLVALGEQLRSMASVLEGIAGEGLQHDLAVLHVLVIGVFLLLRFTKIGRAPRNACPVTRTATEAWRQFLNGWTALWATWLGLYLWLAFAWWDGNPFGVQVSAPLGRAVADLLNTASAFAFAYLFLVLDKPSVRVEGQPERHRDFQNALVTSGTLIAAAATLSFLQQWRGDTGGTSIGSLVVAVAMMYFFGRLDDRDLRIRRWMLAPLYLYVAIQMMWGSVAAESAGGVALLMLALVLKVYIFVVVTAWIRGRALIEYLDRVVHPREM